jgi:hypothetical protein
VVIFIKELQQLTLLHQMDNNIFTIKHKIIETQFLQMEEMVQIKQELKTKGQTNKLYHLEINQAHRKVIIDNILF